MKHIRYNKRIKIKIISLILSGTLFVLNTNFAYATALSRYVLAPPLASKPLCNIIEKPDGTFDVVTNFDVIDFWNKETQRAWEKEENNREDVNKIIVIGGSSGGWYALWEFLKTLPDNHPPIVVCQHLYSNQDFYKSSYSFRYQDLEKFNEYIKESSKNIILSERTALNEPTEYKLKNGMVLVGHYLFIKKDSEGSPFVQLFARSFPKEYMLSDGMQREMMDVNALFTSASEVFKENTICAVFSGAGSDGLDGARSVKKAGGVVLTQKMPEMDDIYYNEMPGEVIKSGLSDETVFIEHMADTIMKYTKPGKNPCGMASRNRWAFVDISYLIAQMLDITQEKKLTNPKEILIPLIKKHIRNREGEGEILLEGFDIDGIKEIKQGEEVKGFSLPVIRDGKEKYRFEYFSQGLQEREKIDRANNLSDRTRIYETYYSSYGTVPIFAGKIHTKSLAPIFFLSEKTLTVPYGKLAISEIRNEEQIISSELSNYSVLIGRGKKQDKYFQILVQIPPDSVQRQLKNIARILDKERFDEIDFCFCGLTEMKERLEAGMSSFYQIWGETLLNYASEKNIWRDDPGKVRMSINGFKFVGRNQREKDIPIIPWEDKSRWEKSIQHKNVIANKKNSLMTFPLESGKTVYIDLLESADFNKETTKAADNAYFKAFSFSNVKDYESIHSRMLLSEPLKDVSDYVIHLKDFISNQDKDNYLKPIETHISGSHGGKIGHCSKGDVLFVRLENDADVLGTAFLQECDACGGKVIIDGEPYLFLYHWNSYKRNKDLHAFLSWLIEKSDSPEELECFISIRRNKDCGDDFDRADSLSLNDAINDLESTYPQISIEIFQREEADRDEPVLNGSMTVFRYGAAFRTAQYDKRAGADIDWNNSKIEYRLFRKPFDISVSHKEETAPGTINDINTPGQLVHVMRQSRYDIEKNRKRIINIFRNGLKPYDEIEEEFLYDDYEERDIDDGIRPDVVCLSMVANGRGYESTQACRVIGPAPYTKNNITLILDDSYVKSRSNKFTAIGEFFEEKSDFFKYYRDTEGVIFNDIERGTYEIDSELKKPFGDEVITEYVPPKAIVGIIALEECAESVKEIICEEFPGKSIRIFNPEGKLLFDIAGKKAETEPFNVCADLIKYVESKTVESTSLTVLGTSWIKGYAEKAHLQHKNINELISSLHTFCEKNNLPFIVGEDEELLSLINEAQNEKAYTKIIVLAGEDTVSKKEFQKLDNAVLAGIDNRRLTADSYMPIIDMLTTTLKLAFKIGHEEDILKESNVFVESKNGYYLFVLDAEPMDYGDLIKRYAPQIFA